MFMNTLCVRNVIPMSGVKWQAIGIRDIVPTESEKNQGYWTWADDVDVVMLDTITTETNGVSELKV